MSFLAKTGLDSYALNFEHFFEQLVHNEKNFVHACTHTCMCICIASTLDNCFYGPF